MSAVEADLGGPAGQPPEMPQVQRSRWQRRRWWRLLIATVAAVLAAVSGLAAWAAAYQPITWGCCEFGPTGSNVRPVNTFGYYREDFYLAPQRGTATFFVTIENWASRPVLIEAVNIGQTWNTVTLAGPVRYSRRSPEGQFMPPHSPVLRDVTLGPKQTIFIEIPLRTHPCAINSGWEYDPSFYVKERFLFFTHTVALPWSMRGGALIMGFAGKRSPGAGTFCTAK